MVNRLAGLSSPVPGGDPSRAWAVVDGLVHPLVRSQALDLVRARLLVVCTLGMVLMGLVLAYLSVVGDPEPWKVVPTILSGCVLGVLLVAYVRKTGRLGLGSGLLCVLVMTLVGGLGLTSSGLHDTALWWLPLGPALGAFLVGPRFAVACALLVTTYLGVLLWMHGSGHVFSPVGPNVRLFIVAGCGSLTLALAAFGWLYDASRKRAFTMLQAALTELERTNAQTREANTALARARDAAEEDARRKNAFLQEMNRLSAQQLTGVREATQVVAGIASAVARMGTSVMTLTVAVRDSGSAVEILQGAGQGVTRSMEEMVRAVADTMDAMERVNASIEQIAMHVEGVQSSADRTRDAMALAERLIGDVQDRAQATAQLSEQVITDADRGREAVRRTLVGAEETLESSSQAAALMASLAGKIGNVDRIVALIRDVADQTNLLSLNAAIIAAQAGEKGRSFAVVATEIKALAESTGKSTRDIASLISAIERQSAELTQAVLRGKTAAEAGVFKSREADRLLEQIVRSSQESTGMVRAIAASTLDQVTSTRAVATEMETVARAVRDLSGSAAQQSEDVLTILGATHRVRQAVTHVQEAARVQAESTLQTKQALDRMGDMTERLNQAQADQAAGAQRVMVAVEQVQAAQVAAAESVEQMVTGRAA